MTAPHRRCFGHSTLHAAARAADEHHRVNTTEEIRRNVGTGEDQMPLAPHRLGTPARRPDAIPRVAAVECRRLLAREYPQQGEFHETHQIASRSVRLA